MTNGLIQKFLASRFGGVWKWLLAVLLCSASQMDAQAHELTSNRVTVVLRDETHLSLTYYVDYLQALRLALAPKSTPTEFVMLHAAMTPADFEKQLIQAQLKFTNQTRVVLPSGEALVFGRWRWPEPARLQAQLQQRAMGNLVNPGEHSHAAPHEIQAEAVSSRKIVSVSVLAPVEFGRVLMVTYKPKQTWLTPSKASAVTPF